MEKDRCQRNKSVKESNSATDAESFYRDNGPKYARYYGLPGLPEKWLTEDSTDSHIQGINNYFDAIKNLPSVSPVNAFDIGVGPAAREILRYLGWGWECSGCDSSKDVLALARNAVSNSYPYFDSNNLRFFDILNADLEWKGCFNFISCLNVIQHFKSQSEVEKLASCVSQRLLPGGYFLLLFKRADFSHERACKLGLKMESDRRHEYYYKYYDPTFMKWRLYQTFDTNETIRLCGNHGMFLCNGAPGKGVLRFFNTRIYPCTALFLERE